MEGVEDLIQIKKMINIEETTSDIYTNIETKLKNSIFLNYTNLIEYN